MSHELKIGLNMFLKKLMDIGYCPISNLIKSK
jgi:hypothetical protein